MSTGKKVNELWDCDVEDAILWLSALNDASIRKALGALKPSAETLSLYYSALARSRADPSLFIRSFLLSQYIPLNT